jgi:hypothetical protein
MGGHDDGQEAERVRSEDADPVVLVVPLAAAGVGAVVAKAVPATQSTTTRNTLRTTRCRAGGCSRCARWGRSPSGARANFGLRRQR